MQASFRYIDSKIQLASPSNMEITYDEALLYCSFLDCDGYNDWRMPTVDEYGKLNLFGWYIGRTSAFSVWYVIPVRDIC